MHGDGAGLGGETSTRPPGASDPIHVLHVDDDPAFGDLTAARLERDDGGARSIRVESASDPEAALDRLAGVDCVVSDFEMPGLDGLELLDAVRERRPNVPFVLFTGRGSEQIASRAISAGVTDYIRKGGSTDRFDVLANRVRNSVARYRAECEAERRETHLRRVVDVLPECIFVKDEAGRYVLMNQAGADTYGREPEEIEGRFEADLLPDDDAETFREEDLAILDSGEPTYLPEQRRRGPDGSLIVERVQKLPFELAPTGEDGVLGVVENITDEYFRERRREAALSTLEDAESALADARGDGERTADAHERCADRLARLRTLLTEAGPIADEAEADADADTDSANCRTGTSDRA